MRKYDVKDVREKTLEYFKGDELATDVWMKKYALKDSKGDYYELTPDDMHHRLAKEFARVEAKYTNPLSEEEIYELIKDFKFVVPQGRPMAGIGNDFQIQSVSNCFVLGNFGDSYGSILYTDQELVQIAKRGGGIGNDLTHIRPDQSPVANAAMTSTGIIPFMERYSNSIREVGQQNRRGANILTIKDNHYQVEDFISAKSDKTKITGSNISIKVSDELIDKVNKNEEFEVKFPVNSDTPQFSKKINSVELWNKIIKQNIEDAEPGMLFWDTIQRESIPDCYKEEGFESISVNPCLSGNEKLLTVRGYLPIKELAEKGFYEIYNKDGFITTAKIWKSGTKKVITFKNSLGEITTCTPDHIWLTTENTDVEANNLLGKKLMPFLVNGYVHHSDYLKLGFIQGDANLSRLSNDTHKGFEINIGINDSDVLNLFKFVKENNNQRKFYTNEFYKKCKDLQFSEETMLNRCLPLTYKEWEVYNKKAFISGLFSANGTVVKNTRIQFKSINKTLIYELQETLKEFGIESYFTTNKEKLNKFSNGEYICKESYDLCINKYNSMLLFYNEIGFIHKYKNDKLKEILISKSPKITKIIDENKIEDVYDFTETETHYGIVNGYVSHNCGEIILSKYDSCRLLVLNLINYVNKPFTTESEFDFELFSKHAYIAQRLMDDLVDLEIEKVDKIIEKIEKDPEDIKVKQIELDLWKSINEIGKKGRRTGLGFTGLGDAIAMLNLNYGESESIIFIDKMQRVLNKAAYKSSIDMAKERGAFPIFNYNKEKDNVYLQRVLENSPELKDDLIKYGRRNIALLTNSPTGSLSTVTQSSSGVEPVFMPIYKRRRKLLSGETNIDFIDKNGDKWQEYIVFHPMFKKYLEIKGYDIDKLSEKELNDIVKNSPYHYSAHNINPFKKVDVIAALQKYNCHAISNTTNLPKTITHQEVSELYKYAHLKGCKGFTIYVDGSRDGVLISNDKPKEVLKNSKIERPKELTCDIHHVSANGIKYYVIVGLLNDKPYEIFCFSKKNITIPPIKKEGKLIKVQSGIYNLQYNGTTIENIAENFESPEEDGFTRVISRLLRSNIPVVDICKDLDKSFSNISSFYKAISRTLRKNYVSDDELNKDSNEKCPECGGILIYAEGCKSCSCGYSRCG